MEDKISTLAIGHYRAEKYDIANIDENVAMGEWGNVLEVLGVMFFNGKWTGNEWEWGMFLYFYRG